MEKDTDDLLSELDDLFGAKPIEETGLLDGLSGPPAVPVLETPASSAADSPSPPDALGAKAAAGEAESGVGVLPRRILMVDDNKDYRDVVSHILRARGFEVELADNGAEGVRRAKELQPGLIIMDFNMPEMNGYEAIQAIRSDDDTRTMPIIMFTGATNRRQLREMGMDISDFLEKPISNDQLVEAVNRVFDSGGAPSPLTGSLPPEPQEEKPIVREIQFTRPPSPPPVQASPAPVPAPPKAAPAPASPRPEALPPEHLPDLAELERQEEEDVDVDDDLLINIEKENDKDKEEDYGLELMAKESPLVAKVNKILVKSVQMGASDIHIEPQEGNISVRVRVNGSLQMLTTMPASLGARLAARLKIMSDLSITERRLPQDGQFRASIKGSKVEFRVSTLPVSHGEKVVLRILGGSKVHADLGGLGLGDGERQSIEKALATPHGLILVTGPTGSGKTTTLYTMLSQVNKPDVNIMTAEDPVEYRLPGISQTHIKPAIGLNFEKTLRAFLRQDPDIMLVGEIRDLETAEIAVKASITGHLVFSTLHTNSAPATVTRLAHMGLAPFLIAASVKLVVAQRLIKVLCPACKLRVGLSEDERKMLEDDEIERLKEVYRGVGCGECFQTGYVGRRPVFEVMPLRSREMRNVILANKSADDIGAQAVQEGMVTLRQAALQTVESGETSVAEALKIMLAE